MPNVTTLKTKPKMTVAVAMPAPVNIFWRSSDKVRLTPY